MKKIGLLSVLALSLPVQAIIKNKGYKPAGMLHINRSMIASKPEVLKKFTEGKRVKLILHSGLVLHGQKKGEAFSVSKSCRMRA